MLDQPDAAAATARTALPDYTKGPRQRLAVEALGRTWQLDRTGDMETIWENMSREEFGEDELMPYWAELWPASLMLLQWLGRNEARIADKTCLDIGCGLGLTAIAASAMGARVVGMDHQWPAVYFSRENAELNLTPQFQTALSKPTIRPQSAQPQRASAVGTTPLWTQMDWCAPAFKPACFDFMWGGDIVYETRFYHPLTALFRECLAPGGAIWLAEPHRSVSRPVWERLAADGFSVRKLLTEPVPVEGYHVTVNLWEMTLPGQGA